MMPPRFHQKVYNPSRNEHYVMNVRPLDYRPSGIKIDCFGIIVPEIGTKVDRLGFYPAAGIKTSSFTTATVTPPTFDLRTKI